LDLVQYDFGDVPRIGGVKIVPFVVWLALSRFWVVSPLWARTAPSVCRRPPLLLDPWIPSANYLLIGIYMEAAFPAIPALVFMIVSIAAVTVLNILGITAIAKANFVVVGLQGLFIVLFVALGLSSITGAGTVDLLAPFTGVDGPDGLSPIFAGSAILCLS